MIQVEHTPPATGPTMAQAHDRRRTFVSTVYGSGSGAAQGLALDSGLFVLEFVLCHSVYISHLIKGIDIVPSSASIRLSFYPMLRDL